MSYFRPTKPVSRRAILVGAAALLIAPSERGLAAQRFECRPAGDHDAELRDIIGGMPIVDVHCHIFNATDLPALEFVEKVVTLARITDSKLSDLPVAQRSPYNLSRKQWNEIYADLEDDFDLLYGNLWNSINLIKSRPGIRLLLTPGYGPERSFLEHLATLDAVPEEGLDRMFLPAVFRHRGRGTSTYLQHWLNYTGAGMPRALTARQASVAKATEQLAMLNARFDESLLGLEDAQRFIMSMVSTRTENFVRLKQAYKVRGVPLAEHRKYFFPAMVDFDYWLDGPMRRGGVEKGSRSFIRYDAEQASEPLREAMRIDFAEKSQVAAKRTTLDEQVDLMKRLSLVFPGEVHAFFPFCPWRQADFEFQRASGLPTGDKQSPLSLLKSAVREAGIVGVKLYPPMGFRPYNNGKVEPARIQGGRETVVRQMFPEHLYERFAYVSFKGPKPKDWKERVGQTFGAMLDKALIELYAFCASENVPIMAHAAPTNFSGGYDYWSNGKLAHQNFSEKSSPANWRPVFRLAGLSELRVNLAHAGFGKGGWPKMIRDALLGERNVYADVSYFDEILEGDTAGSACAAREKFLQILGDDKRLRNRVMYGSDWFMMVQEKYHRNYLDVAVRHVASLASDSADRRRLLRAVFGGNAARYLGFDIKNGPSNLVRLAAFYDVQLKKGSAGHGKAMDRLKALADLAAEPAY